MIFLERSASMIRETSTAVSSDEEKDREGRFSTLLNKSLRVFFRDALRITVNNPLQAYSFLKTGIRQKRAAHVRSIWKERGFHVPPIAIFSITNRCNLHCKGCYSWNLHRSSGPEMSDEKLKNVLDEAKELGISFFVIGGGEPFVRREILDLTKAFPEIIFLIFTNGLLIDGELIGKLKKQKNVVPVISLEGFEDDTDRRRGEGVFKHLKRIIEKLKSNRIFYSVSITLTRYNFTTVTDELFIKNLVDLGCKLFFFVEYSPIQEGTRDWVLNDEQRDIIMDLVRSFRLKFSSLFIAIPGDEEEIGGCLSAGRGFVHISADGNVEPCPFAPYSDSNLRDSSLKEALQSEFLNTIRQNHDQLRETEGGCALWVKRDWVQSLLYTR
jgi:MoaA/NifB/PqqE/SkfB family radical SAM enzyme